ncbi:biotin-dependent carboxyltransferase family protein [Arthrobacter sp. I2-34]|uniref:Biotin-dependent carboxyltransferase family protein n=1 Tax=Arthrobacter hankyongi TaxID=2904801 RepID=A0ABS9LC78_9MICC|nr:biotin-dependent carboxyltransferase family protein [Arthrobacter hankyongi]MCG2624275.1 biotin-dependent carboxyltransferase family protein [Arthrobacter hankyongi]
MITVLQPGTQLLIEDLGRPGCAAVGLSPSGALDTRALRLANRLVGNDPGAAGLELLLGGAELEFDAEALLAVTGACGPLSLAAAGLPPAEAAAGRPVRVPAGARLRIGPARAGLRYYVAVAGGIEAEPLMGSRSTDVLSGLGPAPLRAGDVLAVGSPAGHPDTGWLPTPVPPQGRIVVRVQPGPRLDWFARGTWQRLTGRDWTVSPDSNRVGVRLLGRPLERTAADELPSEGLITGAVQVPASGLPTVFLSDHPVTGGYPVPAVVVPADLPLLAQARPGQPVRFLAPPPDPTS